MEGSMNKRGYECSQEDTDNLLESKRQKLPALASVIVEAVKVDSLQRLCSSLEPLFRKIVSEEVERALSRLGNTKSRSPEPKRIQGRDGRNLQLHFKTRMPPHLFTGGKVEGERGSAIHVVLIDANTGNVVQTGQESASKLNVVVLEGDFNDEDDGDWAKEHFESFEVKEREGKRPILTGDTQVTLKEGVGTLGELTFTDNSSWIRSRKFRLGVKPAQGYGDSFRIRESKTEPFAVKDHRGELYKKHYPPALHDEVWRLDRIAKDGVLHKKLLKSNIVTVEDFLRLLVKDPQKLRNLLGSGMSNRMWENTVEHAKTCVLGGKLYVFYTDQAQATGVVFNHIYEFRGLIANGQFLSLESLNHDQKISADILVKIAYENWHKAVEYDGKLLNCLPMAEKETKSLSFTAQNNRQTVQCHDYYSPVPQYPQFVQQQQQHCSQVLPTLPCNVQDYNSSDGSGSYNGEDWCRTRATTTTGQGQGPFEDNFSEEIRLRSSEMLETDDMQRLLKTFGIGLNCVGTTTQGHGGFGQNDESSSCYGYSVPYQGEEVDNNKYRGERSRGRSGKAVVGWLKLKAALRWGIFIRKKAAERRPPQIVEIE
ncbi:unnamed protein product [Cochlearia groenlandica]